jgi:thioredoxin-related protein
MKMRVSSIAYVITSCVSLLLTVHPSYSQGIDFIKGLTFQQILENAKNEEKFVFVDCYTTWCAPCKKMEKEVYSDSLVGSYFNSHFISMKLQMDKTNDDAEEVKLLYKDAEDIARNCHVCSYPTYLFFAPDGRLISKEGGYQVSDEFISLAMAALTPGKTYDDPFAEYNRLLDEYKQGKKDYASIPYMIEKAGEAGDHQLRNKLYSDYKRYLLCLPKDSLYTKRNLTFIGNTTQSSGNVFFEVFFPNGKRSDKVMGDSHFTSRILDKIIDKEIVDSSIGKSYGNFCAGFSVMRPDAPKPSKKEPDWNLLYRTIKKKYNKENADRAILNAKIRWYGSWEQLHRWLDNYLIKFEKFGIDTSGNQYFFDDAALISVSWHIFLYKNDKRTLDFAIALTKGMLRRAFFTPMYAYWDNYAFLCYKVGKLFNDSDKLNEGIRWEKKRLEAAIADNNVQTTKSTGVLLDAMRQGRSIWFNYNQLSN